MTKRKTTTRRTDSPSRTKAPIAPVAAKATQPDTTATKTKPKKASRSAAATAPPAANQLWQTDCLAGMRDLPAGSVDLVFADPPFNIEYEYDVYRDSMSSDDYLRWCHDWMAEVHRVLKPHGTFWLAIGDEYAAELKVLMQRDLKFHCRSWVIWYYTFGVHCKLKFARSHAHLFHMVKDPQQFTFRAADIRVPSARQLVYGDRRANAAGRVPDDTWILRPQDIPESFADEEDTWYFPRVAGTFKERAGWHGCQMPEQLLGRIIRVSSAPDELVLDPFAGSGSTLVVAKKLGRKYWGFELSENYSERIGERLAATQVGDPLVGAADPTRSAPSTSDGCRLTEDGHRVPTRGKSAPGKSAVGKPAPSKSAAGKSSPGKSAAGKPAGGKSARSKPAPSKPATNKSTARTLFDL